MSKVHKHCSILNYIRHADKELHDLIQDLCIGRIFVPKRGSPGLTFLRPDKELLEKLKKDASGDNPEEAVAALQSMVLLDNYDSIEDFESNKNDISTYLRKKLPVASVARGKVVLANGAEISPDKQFEARGDRSNISVYLLSRALVPTNTEPSAARTGAPVSKKVKGGAEYGNNRQDLFNTVLGIYVSNDSNRNAALEVLVSILKWSESDSQKHLLLCSLLSSDALASLAVILQPFRTSGFSYISDQEFTAISTKYSISASHMFCYVDSPVAYYKACMNKVAENTAVVAAIQTARDNLAETVSKLTSIRNIIAAYKAFASNTAFATAYPVRAGILSTDFKLAFAESELRVLSALMHETAQNDLTVHELRELFSKCSLVEPYLCAEIKNIADANVAHYFSTVYLIARSDAFVSHPGLNGEPLGSIANENVKIDVASACVLNDRMDDSYNAHLSVIKELIK